jgi:hypothetical protein
VVRWRDLVPSLGEAARKPGDEAEERAKACVAKDPYDAAALETLLVAALERRRVDEISTAAIRLLEAYEQRGERQLSSALIKEFLDPAAPLLPTRFFLSAAALCDKQGRHEEAYDAYEALVERTPTDPSSVRALVRMAEIRMQGGNASEARELYELVLFHPACTGDSRTEAQRILRSERFRSISKPWPSRLRISADALAGGYPLGVHPPERVGVALGAGARGVSSDAPLGTLRRWLAMSREPLRDGPSWSWPRIDTRMLVGALVLSVVMVAILLSRAVRVRGATASTPPSPEAPAPMPTASSEVPAEVPVAIVATPAAILAPRISSPLHAPVDSPFVALGHPTLRVSFRNPIPSGSVTVRVGENEVFSQGLDTPKGAVTLPIDEVVAVPEGASELRVWVIASDRSVSAHTVLPALFKKGESRTLELELRGKGLTATLK